MRTRFVKVASPRAPAYKNLVALGINSIFEMELSKATKALIVHPASHFPAKGRVFPRPEFDPNPELTLALHTLWAIIRPYLIISPTDGSISTRCRASKLAEVLMSFRPALVSLSLRLFLLSIGSLLK